MFAYLTDVKDLKIKVDKTSSNKTSDDNIITSKNIKRDVRTLRVIHAIIIGIAIVLFVVYLALEFRQGKSDHLVTSINIHQSDFFYVKGPYTPTSVFLHIYTVYIPIIVYISTVIIMYIIPIILELDKYSSYIYETIDNDTKINYSVMSSSTDIKDTYNMDLYYISLLFNGTNAFYCILESVAGSALLWTILQLSGIHNVLLIIGTIVINIIANTSGLFNHELINSGLTLLPNIIEGGGDLRQTSTPNWICFVFSTLFPTLFISSLLVSSVFLSDQHTWTYKAMTISYASLLIITKLILPFFFYIGLRTNDTLLLYRRNRNYYISKTVSHGVLYTLPFIFIIILSQ